MTQRVFAVNCQLEALPESDRARMLAGCETVDLAFVACFDTAGDRLRDCLFSDRVLHLSDHASRRFCLPRSRSYRNEGMLGIPLVLGVDVSPVQAVVHGTGFALRMDAPVFCRELGHSPALQREIDRHIFVHFI